MKNKNIIAVRNLIRHLDLESLKNPEVVANLVRAFGIVQWGPAGVFGNDDVFKNQSADMAGIYQTPIQIAECLVYLSKFEINSFLEVGVFQGGNFLFMSEYLKRFNPLIDCTGIDPTNFLNDEVRMVIESEIDLSFKAIDSDKMAGRKFDLVFLDGDHTKPWIKKDWDNVGKYAGICALHDIHGPACPDVVAFWKDLKSGNKKTIEFIKSTLNEPLQGIGVIHNGKKGGKA